MFRNMIIGQYIPRESFIHHLDPRSKIISVFALLIGIFLIGHPLGYLLLTGFSFWLVAGAKIPPRDFLNSLKPIFWFVIFTVIFQFFLTEGQVLTRLGPLVVTKEGLERGIILGWRLLLLIIFSSLLTLTTSPLSLTDGLETLLKPFKKIGLPVHELAMMITIALRFIPTLLEETEKIMKAQTARGMDFSRGSILQRIKSLIPLLVPLFISAFRRADDLATAMEARCYRGGVGRTKMKQLKMNLADGISLTLVAILIVLSLLTNHYGNWSA